MIHPAFLAIKAATDGVMKSHIKDVDVHDKALIDKYPDAPFLYGFRENGTHLVPLGQGKADEESKGLVEAFLDCNTHFRYWDGKSLRTTTKEALIGLLDSWKPLFFQF